MSFVEKVFNTTQLIPEHFSREENGVLLFPRYFLYRYYFVKEKNMEKMFEMFETMSENYVVVRRCDTGEFILYTPHELKFSSDEEHEEMKKIMKENGHTSGMVWWGVFIEDFKFYLSTSNHTTDFCECDTKRERKKIRFEYKIRCSTKEKYLSMVVLMVGLCECKCSTRYWANELINVPEQI